ncbi:MAG: alpha/beta fold hydrolase, partial [Microthrixaceae bacterium]
MPTIRANGIDIYHESFGDPENPTLLLVNGLGAQAVGYEPEYCRSLVELGLHVIRYDNRDVGLSTHIDADGGDLMEAFATAVGGGEVEAPYTLSDMASDGMCLLAELGVESAHVAGSSMGGMIVQTMAIEHSHRVLSMTSVMSTTGEVGFGMPDPDCLAGLATIMVPTTTREERISSGVELQRLIGTPTEWDEDRTTAKVVEQLDRSYDPDGTSRQMLAVLASGSREEGLSTLDLPAMVLHGDVDRLVHISGGERTAELVSDAEFRVMD